MGKHTGLSRNSIEVGQSYSKWLVLERLNTTYWLCKCECGVENSVAGYTLVKGTSRQCRNCSNRDKAEKIRISGDHVAARQAWAKLNGNAKSRGLTCSIEFDDFYRICKMPCTYCNAEPCGGYWENSTYRREWHDAFISNGLDRYNNLIGYELDNVVPCCARCNRSKNDMSLAEWAEKIRQWSSWLDAVDTPAA